MNEAAKLGVVGFLALLAGFGGSVSLSSDELAHAYVCDVTQEWGIFPGGLSGTSYSAYPQKGSRSEAEYCRNVEGEKGTWQPLKEYADAQGISLEETMSASNCNTGNEWYCDDEECWPYND